MFLHKYVCRRIEWEIYTLISYIGPTEVNDNTVAVHAF